MVSIGKIYTNTNNRNENIQIINSLKEKVIGTIIMTIVNLKIKKK